MPLTQPAREALDSVCPEVGYLFPRKESGSPADYRMTLRRAAREAGLSKERAARISDYDFRHGRTTHLVEKTGNILGAGFLVGHKHATTTNTYLHARSSMAKSVLEAVAGEPLDVPQRESGDEILTQYCPTPSIAGVEAVEAVGESASDSALVRGTGLEPARLAAPEPKACAEAAKLLSLLESESSGRDRKRQEETEYRPSVSVTGGDVERAIMGALEAWRAGDPERARAALREAIELVGAALLGGQS